MAKRFSHVQPYSFVTKKPKLDISIGRRDENAGSSVKQRIYVRPPSPHASENFFDDADDDVILLASQSVEAQHTREHFTQQVVINESCAQISFDEFANGIHTSTQILNKHRDKVDPPKSIVNDAFDNIEKYFEDEIQLNDINAAEKWNLPKEVCKNHFKRKESNQLDPEKSSKERDGLVSQINYLTEKTVAYKRQIEKLAKDSSEFNDKIQTKEGEVSMVRYQLRQIQQQNDNLRLEKMQEIDNIKKEWQEKIGDLEKLIRSQQNELEFKNLEIVSLKSSRMNDSQRSLNLTDAKKDFKKVAFLHNLHLDMGRKSLIEWGLRKLPPEVFDNQTTPIGKLRFRDAVFKKELSNFQSCLSQLNIMKIDSLNSTANGRMVMCLKNTLKLLINYAQRLEFMKYTDTNASVEYKFLCEEPSEKPHCLLHHIEASVFNEAKMYPSEKAEVARRLVAAFAVACKYSAELCKHFLTQKLGNNTFFGVIVEIVNMFGFSKELFVHFGMLESFEYLLLSFIENSSECEANADMIVQCIRSLVFCRLGFRSLVKMSECMLRISSMSKRHTVLNLLCTNSPLGSFVFNEYYKIIQFTPRSCILQVYGTLLENAFPQDVPLTNSQHECLLQICRNHITFLRNCLEHNVKWILTPESNAKNCDCYAKAVNSSVILIHLALKTWISNPKQIDTRTVASISRDGILLICDSFHKNYSRDVLQNGGSTIKHRLHMIHNWLTDFKAVLQLKSAHIYALQSIMLSHIIEEPIHLDEATTKKSSQNDDSIWCNIFDDFI